MLMKRKNIYIALITNLTKMMNRFFLFAIATLCVSCNPDSKEAEYVPVSQYPAVEAAFGDKLDLDNLYNYEKQAVPAYISKDNTVDNFITDEGATLGRVLFYDKKLSANNTISCASCHQQEHAFSDLAVSSIGMNGLTARHTMRLVNARYANETKFFWDERAETLELQTTQPVQNHAEMGYSGTDGDPAMADLLVKLQAVPYYKELFKFVYGDEEVTENRIQLALSQFVRSITSFDSKYDMNRSQAANNNDPFPGFTQQENIGKNLFNQPAVLDAQAMRTGGGLSCAGCHAAPEFDIDPQSQNNGVTSVLGFAGQTDLMNTRAPSLRDLMKTNGTLNGPLMHDGSFTTIEAVIEHYNSGITLNRNLDPRLKRGNFPQQLNMTAEEKAAVKAFLLTLSGTAVYTDVKWSSPFGS